MFAVIVITDENINELIEHFKHDDEALVRLKTKQPDENLLLLNSDNLEYTGLSRTKTFMFENAYLDFDSLSDALACLLMPTKRALNEYRIQHISYVPPRALKRNKKCVTKLP